MPRHVAIIMDGNGRWARRQGKPRIMGHRAGVETVREIVRVAGENGIEVLTLYAFSTENWQRPPAEVEGLMGLLQSFLESQLAELTKNNVRLRASGRLEQLPPAVRRVLTRTIDQTAGNSGLILNLALSYGGREELLRAARHLAQACQDGRLSPEAISEERFAAELYTAGLPDPDLLIRTGGEQRLSNFLLWQTSYSELYFTQTCWPDFHEPEFLAALADFRGRQRRFGQTGEQVEQAPCNG